MDDLDALREKFLARLREAKEIPQPPVEDPTADVGQPTEGTQPEEATDAPGQEDPGTPADAPPDQGTPAGDGLAQAATPSFPSNTHRFAYAAGEAVSFFGESGERIDGTIAGPPIGDKFSVQHADGGQTTVLKSELFYTSAPMPTDQAPEAQQPEGQQPPQQAPAPS